MQAPVLKQATPNTFVSLALALGLAASIAVNVVLITRSGDDAAPAAATQSNANRTALVAEDQEAAALYEARFERGAVAQAIYTGSHQGLIDVDQLVATQNATLAAKSGSSTSNTGLVDVDQLLADQHAPLVWETHAGPHQGQIDLDQFQADQRFAPTALDRFIIEAAP